MCTSANAYYSKGQMYSYLASLNGVLLCTDEDYYAQKAYTEYLNGGSELYINNAMAGKAVAKIHALDDDSARFWIDTCLFDAIRLNNDYLKRNILSVKANYDLLIDSLSLARQTYKELIADSGYVLNSQDCCNIAFIYANDGDTEHAYKYLNQAKELLYESGTNIKYLIKSIDVASLLGNKDSIINAQDSLIMSLETELDNALVHASIASQYDYAEIQLQKAELSNLYNKIYLAFLSLCFIFSSIVFILVIRKKNLQKLLQSEKIEKLQLQIEQHQEELANGLQQIKANSIVTELQDCINKTGIPHVEWNQLYSLFCNKLPLFEKSLRELASISETEWRVCMLLKLGFSPSDIAILMNKSKEGIASIRRRLYEKVFKKKGKPSEWDKFVESL